MVPVNGSQSPGDITQLSCMTPTRCQALLCCFLSSQEDPSGPHFTLSAQSQSQPTPGLTASPHYPPSVDVICLEKPAGDALAPALRGSASREHNHTRSTSWVLIPLSLERSNCLGTMLCNLLTRSELAGIPSLTAHRHTKPITSYGDRQALLLRSQHNPPSPQATRAGRSHPIPDQEHPAFSRYNSKAHRSVAYLSQTPGSS